MYRKGWVELERSWKVAVEARNGRRRVGKVLEGYRGAGLGGGMVGGGGPGRSKSGLSGVGRVIE